MPPRYAIACLLLCVPVTAGAQATIPMWDFEVVERFDYQEGFTVGGWDALLARKSGEPFCVIKHESWNAWATRTRFVVQIDPSWIPGRRPVFRIRVSRARLDTLWLVEDREPTQREMYYGVAVMTDSVFKKLPSMGVLQVEFDLGRPARTIVRRFGLGGYYKYLKQFERESCKSQ